MARYIQSHKSQQVTAHDLVDFRGLTLSWWEIHSWKWRHQRNHIMRLLWNPCYLATAIRKDALRRHHQVKWQVTAVRISISRDRLLPHVQGGHPSFRSLTTLSFTLSKWCNTACKTCLRMVSSWEKSHVESRNLAFCLSLLFVFDHSGSNWVDFWKLEFRCVPWIRGISVDTLHPWKKLDRHSKMLNIVLSGMSMFWSTWIIVCWEFEFWNIHIWKGWHLGEEACHDLVWKNHSRSIFSIKFCLLDSTSYLVTSDWFLDEMMHHGNWLA
jgi:hypothetical protein